MLDASRHLSLLSQTERQSSIVSRWTTSRHNHGDIGFSPHPVEEIHPRGMPRRGMLRPTNSRREPGQGTLEPFFLMGPKSSKPIYRTRSRHAHASRARPISEVTRDPLRIREERNGPCEIHRGVRSGESVTIARFHNPLGNLCSSFYGIRGRRFPAECSLTEEWRFRSCWVSFGTVTFHRFLRGFSARNWSEPRKSLPSSGRRSTSNGSA